MKTQTTRSSHLVHEIANKKIGSGHVIAALGVWLVITVVLYQLINNYRTFLLIGGVLTGVMSFTMAVMMIISQTYIFRREDLDTTKLPEVATPSELSIGVIIPARHETTVLHSTLFNFAYSQAKHHDHKIFTVINDDDPETLALAYTTAKVINDGHSQRVSWAEISANLNTAYSTLQAQNFTISDAELKRLRLSAGNSLVVVVEYPLEGKKPNKPQQLNYVFEKYSEDFTIFTVFDAESKAQADLLVKVDQLIRDHPGTDVFQGGIQLIEPDLVGSRFNRFRISLSHWYAKLNALEYYRWFGSQMFYQADKQFMPLGGNTLFLRRELLHKTGGWPPSLTEDCELGVRATAIHHAKTLAFYDPKYATREETPGTLKSLIKQRRRWNIGFLQSFFAGNWRGLPTLSQRLFAFRILTMSMFQAGTFVLLPLTLITFFWIKSPAPLAVLLCLPVIMIIMSIALEIISLRDYGRAFERPIRWYTCVFCVVVYFPYQLVLSYAAAQAIWGYVLGRLEWDKTHHKQVTVSEPERQVA